MISVVVEVEWLDRTEVKVRLVVLRGVWALLVVGRTFVGTVAKIHESSRSMPSWGKLSQV